MKPLESDWKIYNELIPFWRDRFLLKKNEEIISILTRENKTQTENFWDSKALIEKQARVLDQCLGYHSRSKMWMSILLMHNYGLIQDKDLERFSESLRQDILSSAKVKMFGDGESVDD